MIEVRELQDGDLEYARENCLEEAIKTYPQLHPQKPSYTALADGKIVGVGGVAILWEGVGEAWLILTRDVLTIKIQAYKCIKQMCKTVIEERNLRRIQATVRVDFPQANRMMQHLRFENEGILKNYCPDGCDVIMYARIR